MNSVLKGLVALLLLEAVTWGGVHTIRSILDAKDAAEYWALWQQERVERRFWQEKIGCAKKLNGCSPLAVERRVK